MLQSLEETSENLVGIFCNIPLFESSLLLDDSLQDGDDELCLIAYVDTFRIEDFVTALYSLS